MDWAAISSYLHTLNPISIFIRMLLATICGGIVGINRARKHRPAGFRTHMLVCLGACLVMLTSQFIVNEFGINDPTRMGAQVISGIGFLGAGTIVVSRRNQVLGLTTAAGLWANACIGLAAGIGFYTGAIMGTLFLIIIVVIFHNMDQWLQASSRNMQFIVEFKNPSVLTELLGYLSNNSIMVKHVEIIEARDKRQNIASILELQLPKRGQHEDVVYHVRKLEGIIYFDLL